MTKNSAKTTNTMDHRLTIWTVLYPPEMEELPRSVYVRATTIPEKCYFPSHSHPWHQLVYASAGTLRVKVEGQSFIIPPEQAVWLPAGKDHATHSMNGAEFRSLYITQDASKALSSEKPHIIKASPLMRELILTASTFPADYQEEGYEGQVIALLLEEIARMPSVGLPLPWPQSAKIEALCSELYDNPGDDRPLSAFAAKLGVSSRTLTRHLEQETGLSFREWRNRLRLFKAIEMLGEGKSVTTTALHLGYSAPSAFIALFRKTYGMSPLQYMKQNSKSH